MFSRLISRAATPMRMAAKPLTRSFATPFYNSPLFHCLQQEYQSVSETEEKDVTSSIEKMTKQFNKMGWEVVNDYGSSIVSLSKQIADDEDVFVSFKADMQSDISVPEDKESSYAELEFKVFQNVGTHVSESTSKDGNMEDSYGIDLQMIFVCNSSPDKPLEVVHMDSAVGVESDSTDPMMGEDRYPGPPYDEWDDNVKKSVIDHLKDLGITENFAKLLRQFALDKEYSEYINFLRNIAIEPEQGEPSEN